MTREEAIRELKIFNGTTRIRLSANFWEALNMAIKALAQEPSEDAISRQSVVEYIKASDAELGHDLENYQVVEDILNMPPVTPTTCIAKVTFSKDDLQELVDEKVEELAQHMESRWIPCSERLPKAGEYVDDVAKYYLVQNEYGDVLVARYTHSGYWEQIYRMEPIADEIVAWMPLPEPYKAEMESEE